MAVWVLQGEAEFSIFPHWFSSQLLHWDLIFNLTGTVGISYCRHSGTAAVMIDTPQPTTNSLNFASLVVFSLSFRRIQRKMMLAREERRAKSLPTLEVWRDLDSPVMSDDWEFSPLPTLLVVPPRSKGNRHWDQSVVKAKSLELLMLPVMNNSVSTQTDSVEIARTGQEEFLDRPLISYSQSLLKLAKEQRSSLDENDNFDLTGDSERLKFPYVSPLLGSLLPRFVGSIDLGKIFRVKQTSNPPLIEINKADQTVSRFNMWSLLPLLLLWSHNDHLSWILSLHFSLFFWVTNNRQLRQRGKTAKLIIPDCFIYVSCLLQCWCCQ